MTREQVIKALEQHTVIRDCTGCPYIAEPKCRQRLLDDALALLKESKPVKHGRWIKMTGMMPPEYHGHYECSECQWHMKGIRSSWTREEELAYCPNCGVIMDGEASGTE